MKKYTTLLLTLALVAAVPANAMSARDQRISQRNARRGEKQGVDVVAMQAATDRLIAQEESKQTRNKRLKYAAAATLATGATAATAVALYAYCNPEQTCAQVANVCADSGYTVCQNAMEVCSAYLPVVEASYWTEFLTFLGLA